MIWFAFTAGLFLGVILGIFTIGLCEMAAEERRIHGRSSKRISEEN
jgi:uncharacterized membrane-anchored protein YhcB (DUF1043 family)